MDAIESVFAQMVDSARENLAGLQKLPSWDR